MNRKKTNPSKTSKTLPALFALVCILALTLRPSPLLAQQLRLVYGNDNLGELAPCG